MIIADKYKIYVLPLMRYATMPAYETYYYNRIRFIKYLICRPLIYAFDR
jgi:hypothetical protein